MLNLIQVEQEIFGLQINLRELRNHRGNDLILISHQYYKLTNLHEAIKSFQSKAHLTIL